MNKSILTDILIEKFLTKQTFICVDFNHYSFKKSYFKRREAMLFHEIKVGSWLFEKNMHDYEKEAYNINIEKLAEKYGYYLKRGKKYLFAVKENTLNLFD